MTRRAFAKDMTIAVVALAFTFWALAGSGQQAVYYGMFCFLLGVPLYVWLRTSQAKKPSPAAPAPSDPGHTGQGPAYR
jgi:APA family basic amino acid/polyamine antiporter